MCVFFSLPAKVRKEQSFFRYWIEVIVPSAQYGPWKRVLAVFCRCILYNIQYTPTTRPHTTLISWPIAELPKSEFYRLYSEHNRVYSDSFWVKKWNGVWSQNTTPLLPNSYSNVFYVSFTWERCGMRYALTHKTCHFVPLWYKNKWSEPIYGRNRKIPFL